MLKAKLSLSVLVCLYSLPSLYSYLFQTCLHYCNLQLRAFLRRHSVLYVVPVFILPLLMEAVATVKCTSFSF